MSSKRKQSLLTFSREEKKIFDDILDAVGNTPLVRLNSVTKGLKSEILAKCEYLNPGGSVKDRIARRMVLDAEKTGRLKKGDIIIEPTSGNTGIGLAMSAAARGYKMIITMPEKMSAEKENTLKALGAEIIRTPTEYLCAHKDSHIGVAMVLNEQLENSHILDQYANPSNPLAHYQGTAQEIWDQCEGKVDKVILSAGTGGTITGIARFFKDKDPNVEIIGVDPHGSILAQPESLNTELVPYHVEGIGYDFIPRVLDRTVIDKWVKSADTDSLYWGRRLIKEEGILAGGSSGSALWAAIEEAKKEEGKRIVIILPDSIRNYMTKFLSDDWMYENGFLSEQEIIDSYTPKLVPNKAWGQTHTVADLNPQTVTSIQKDATVGQAIEQLRSNNLSQVPVVDESGKIFGILESSTLINHLSKSKLQLDSQLGHAINKNFRKISSTTPVSELGRVFARCNYVVVDGEKLLTHADYLDFFKTH